MDIRNLRKISISHLILIILNDKNNDFVRKCAEIELRKRIKNVGWEFDDLLHFDDKVIKKRGLDVENYLISPNVNMQQLMEVYFNYNKGTNYETNGLLFSEKHLCNEMDYGDPFFGKVVAEEINNLDRRINVADTTLEKELFKFIRILLQYRQYMVESVKKENKQENGNLIELLCSNEAMCQLDSGIATCHEFWYNLSDEERYKLIKSPTGMIRQSILMYLDDTLFDPDIMQDLSGLMFVRRDSRKLNKQKKQLLQQVKSGFEVDYQSEEMCKVIHKVKRD
jgi:hypothetical protein